MIVVCTDAWRFLNFIWTINWSKLDNRLKPGTVQMFVSSLEILKTIHSRLQHLRSNLRFSGSWRLIFRLLSQLRIIYIFLLSLVAKLRSIHDLYEKGIYLNYHSHKKIFISYIAILFTFRFILRLQNTSRSWYQFTDLWTMMLLAEQNKLEKMLWNIFNGLNSVVTMILFGHQYQGWILYIIEYRCFPWIFPSLLCVEREIPQFVLFHESFKVIFISNYIYIPIR